MKQNAFEWDNHKNTENLKKHGVAFELAKIAFNDPDRIIAIDLDHTTIQKNVFFVSERLEKEFSRFVLLTEMKK